MRRVQKQKTDPYPCLIPMELTGSTPEYPEIKWKKLDWDRFRTSWDMARQSQKSESAFIQAGVFIWQNTVVARSMLMVENIWHQLGSPRCSELLTICVKDFFFLLQHNCTEQQHLHIIENWQKVGNRHESLCRNNTYSLLISTQKFPSCLEVEILSTNNSHFGQKHIKWIEVPSYYN